MTCLELSSWESLVAGERFQCSRGMLQAPGATSSQAQQGMGLEKDLGHLMCCHPKCHCLCPAWSQDVHQVWGGQDLG